MAFQNGKVAVCSCTPPFFIWKWLWGVEGVGNGVITVGDLFFLQKRQEVCGKWQKVY